LEDKKVIFLYIHYMKLLIFEKTADHLCRLKMYIATWSPSLRLRGCVPGTPSYSRKIMNFYVKV